MQKPLTASYRAPCAWLLVAFYFAERVVNRLFRVLAQLANRQLSVFYSESRCMGKMENGRPPVVGATDGHCTHRASHEYNRGPPA